MTLMSSMAMGYMGILPGSAQSLISGNAQYHRPFSLHLGGAMLLHITGATPTLITKLIGLTNTFVPLRIARISLVQLVWVLGRGEQRYSKMYRLKRYRYTIFEKKIELSDTILLAKIFVTNEAIEKTKQKFSCTDEAIKSAQICEFL
jgi:hypothetical protein